MAAWVYQQRPQHRFFGLNAVRRRDERLNHGQAIVSSEPSRLIPSLSAAVNMPGG
jgi:hypothetical protein